MDLLRTADDNNTYDEDETKAFLSLIEKCQESSVEQNTEEIIEPTSKFISNFHSHE